MTESTAGTATLTGAGLLESIDQLVRGIRSRDWVDVTLSGVSASVDAFTFRVDPVGTVAAWGFSWLMEHVRPLQQVLDQLAGNTDQANAHMRTWQGVAAAVRGHRDAVDGQSRRMASQWTGAAGDAAGRHVREHRDVLDAAARIAEGIAAVIGGSAAVVALVRGVVRDLVAQCLATLAVRLPTWIVAAGVSAGTAVAGIAAQASAVVAQFGKTIARLTKALTSSLRRLGGYIGQLRKLIQHVRTRIGALHRSGAPLSFEEHWAVSNYTRHHFYEINKFLRGEYDGPFIKNRSGELRRRFVESPAWLTAQSEKVSAALAKLPPHKGPAYRGKQLSEEKLARYVPGKVVTEPAFTSASAHPKVAYEGNTYFIIHGRNGRVLGEHSFNHYEQEILFDKGTKFLVKSKHLDPTTGRWTIELNEVR